MSKHNRLRDIIEERGTTQTWIAKRAGVKVSTVNELVNQKREPTLATARKIAKALNMEIGEIWPDELEPK